MGNISSTLQSFALLTIGFLTGFYLSERNSSRIRFEGLGKKLDSAINGIDRRLKGEQNNSPDVNEIVDAVIRPFNALFNEVGSWFSSSGLPSGDFTR